MRFSFGQILSVLTLTFSYLVAAERVVETNSLNPCMKNSQFTANLFRVAVTPDNSSASVKINGVSSISGNVIAKIELIAYGFTAIKQTINPCSAGLGGFCPMTKGTIPLDTNIAIPASALKIVPGIAWYVPDFDAIIRVTVFSQETGAQVACLEAELSNTKSVYQKGVGWATAIIAGLALVASGITSGLGNANTAAHVAANAMSLFGLFQAQAVIGMTSVSMPPIVQSWTQNFQWSMGIIRVGFLQSLATWYQRATGGTPTTYLSTLSSISVQVQKRAIRRSVEFLVKAAYAAIPTRLMKRATETSTSGSQTVVVRGIDRVGFRANIEQTNIFMTGLIFFLAVLVFVSLLVAAAKGGLEIAARAGWLKSDKFKEFRNGWRIVIKGILFRLVLLGYVQMAVLCLWQLVERDSPAEIVLALFVFISVTACLAYASFKVIMLAKRSVMMHKNPGYILYSDPACLNKWGFLYVSYKSASYWFVVVLLGYILCKAIFIAFAQSAPVAQAIGLLIIEAGMLIAVSVLKPWMDKKTNAFNISIAAVNFVNSVFLLIFSNAFGQPAAVAGVMGVIFAVYNIIFVLVLLIMVIVSSIIAITSKNPDTRYQAMRDDRGSFIKSQSALTAELDALGQTARGTEKQEFTQVKDIDNESLSSESINRLPTEARSTSQLGRHNERPTMADRPGSRGPPPPSHNNAQGGHLSRPTTAPSPLRGPSPSGGYRSQGPPPRSAQGPPPRPAQGGYAPQQFRSQNSSSPSPWQRGAGYEH